MERAILRGNISRYRNLLANGSLKDRDVVQRLLADAEQELRELEKVSTSERAGGDGVLLAIAETALDEAMRLVNAQFGNVQIYDPGLRALVILAQRNFRKPFLDHFAVVTASEGSACARALADRLPTCVEDVETDPAFEPHRHVARLTGFRAVLSVPLVSGSDRLIGILSVHFSQPRQFCADEIAAMMTYCTSVALALERSLVVEDGTYHAGAVDFGAADQPSATGSSVAED